MVATGYSAENSYWFSCISGVSSTPRVVKKKGRKEKNG